MIERRADGDLRSSEEGKAFKVSPFYSCEDQLQRLTKGSEVRIGLH